MSRVIITRTTIWEIEVPNNVALSQQALEQEVDLAMADAGPDYDETNVEVL